MSTEPSVFTRIINRELPADIVFEDEKVIVIPSIEPKAPVHLLAITKHPYLSIDELAGTESAEQKEDLWHLFQVAVDVARQQGLASSGYRLVTNAGNDAGQTVHHLHVHILGGAPLGEDTLAK